ncbi:NAD(P)H oxidoreductase [Nocardia bovistercoris]|uniref:NAD(P)H oxidoreductase n=1 Tax=Nocardia bovistercoris TaxID=2785916 RepID=A0A931IHA5_9NOCA|nr:NAD(P)H oxidoreductase [Nocardia bovistercoris]
MQYGSNASRTALVVVAHHRADSLTAHIGRRTVAQMAAAGYTVDVLDLNDEGFDPRMTVADQPDWNDREKVYSTEVGAHMHRLLAAERVVVVFPVYWASLPALLKGWIDRVWNYGFAYGRSTPRLAGKRILWLGLAGATADDPAIEAMQAMLDNQLNDSIAFYCGFSSSTVGLLPDAEERPQSVTPEGELLVGEAISGAKRDAHYTGFEGVAADFVTAFLTSEPAPVAALP